MKKWEVRLMLAFWKGWNAATGYRLIFRCNGYRQIGSVDGYRTHMAQYCVRVRGHKGRCLAVVNAQAERVPALFDDEGEYGWSSIG